MTLPAPPSVWLRLPRAHRQKKANEAQARFKARPYVSQLHADAHRTATRHSKLVRTCEKCGAAYGKRRHPSSGKYESRRDFENRRHCSDCTRPWNSSENRQPAKPPAPLSPFDPATRLPDPRPLQTLSDNPKNGSNMKRLPSLLEAERASGVTLEPVTVEQFKRARPACEKASPGLCGDAEGRKG